MLSRKKWLLLAALSALTFTLCAAACSPQEDPPEETETHTITFVMGHGASADPITAEAGEDISQKLPAPESDESYYFGGWYDADFQNELSLPAVMPEEDRTYYARWYVKWSIEQQLQTAKMDGYEKGETLDGEANMGSGLPAAAEDFLASVPQGFVANSQNDPSDFQLDQKDNHFVLRYDRAAYELTYDSNLPDGVDAEEIPSETVYFGVEHPLSSAGLTVKGYRFEGWSLAPGGDLITSVVPQEDVTVYAVWNRSLTDYFGGSDDLFLSRSGKEVYLVRGDMEKTGSYDAASSVFTFEREDGTLSGKITGDKFFYFKDLWQTVFHSTNGETLELKGDGTAVFNVGETPVNGTWSIDFETGYFSLTANGTERLFVIDLEQEEPVFSFSGSEQGWYALEEEDGYGYDLLFLDGFGKMSVYAVSPMDPAFDSWLDVYSGTYHLDETDGVWVANYTLGVYGSTFPFRLSALPEHSELDGVTLKGTYVFGDYRGTFTDLDNEYTKLYLDGFGKGTYGYDASEGTYTVKEDSWTVDNYPAPSKYAVDVVHFTVTSTGDEYLFAIYDEGVFLELTADFYGRYDFEVPPESIYPGSHGDVAFMYFSGYTIYVDEAFAGHSGSFNDAAIWFGNYEPKYSVEGYTDADLPLYDWRDDGAVFPTEKENVYLYVSSREDVSFEFEISGNKILWHISEQDAVFYEADGEKLWVDTFGVGHYEKNGTQQEVEFGYNSFLKTDSLVVEEEADFSYLVLCSFLIDGTYRSFTYSASIDQTGFNGTLADLKEVTFVSYIGSIGLIIGYEDKAVVGLDMSLLGGTGFWFPFTGTLGHPAGETDAWTFTADGTAPEGSDAEETEVYKMLFERFGSLRFKLSAPEKGICTCLEYDGKVYDINCLSGKLKTDGYGTALFTPAGGKEYQCTYLEEDGVLYLTYENGDDLLSWYLILSEDSFVLAGKEAGVYFSYDENGSLDENNMLIINGNSSLAGYYEGIYFEGPYEATGETITLAGVLFTEYKITVSQSEGELPKTLYALVALASEEARVGLVYFRDETAAGTYDVVDANGDTIGALQCDGYSKAVFLSANEGTFYGEMYRGDSVKTARTNEDGERDFVTSIEGTSILFLGEQGEEFLFDLNQDGQALLRDYEYGLFYSYENGAVGSGTLWLDGHGNAEITAEEGKTNAFCEPFGTEGAYRITDADGKTLCIVNFTVVDNSDDDLDLHYGYLYVYRLYSEGTDGVFVNEDWSMLILNGFGDASYIDPYGKITPCEALPIDDTSVLLRPNDGSADKFIVLSGTSFEEQQREFIVSEDGTLLAYYGEGGSISLPDEVLCVASGVFDGVELTHVDFNKVEVVEAYAFAYQDIDGVDAPALRIIGERAFAGENGYDDFEIVDLPAAVEIGEGAFIGRANLETVKLKAITSIGSQAFASCGASYSSLTIDLTQVQDASVLSIADDAFLALSAKTLCIKVKDIATVNGILKQGSWPQKAADALVLWTDPSSYGPDFLVDFTDGAVFEYENGVICKVSPDENGLPVSEIAALYTMEGDTMSVYLKQGNAYLTQAITADTSAPFILTLGTDIALSQPDYEEYHELTIGGTNVAGGTLKIGFSMYSSSSEDYLSKYRITIENSDYTKYVYVADAEGNDLTVTDVVLDISTGTLSFSIAEDTIIRYAVKVTSAAACELQKLGEQKTITTQDEAFTLTFLIDEKGAPAQIIFLFSGYLSQTILQSSIDGNTISIVYEASRSMVDTLSFTYDPASGQLTYTVTQHNYHAANIYLDGRCADADVIFGDDCKIKEVSFFGLRNGYGEECIQMEFTVQYNDDGSAVVTLADGTRVKLTVESGYSYSVSMELLS